MFLLSFARQILSTTASFHILLDLSLTFIAICNPEVEEMSLNKAGKKAKS